MASYLLDRITPGTIIVFRYLKPGVDSRARDILVLNTNYLGILHGLKVEQLTPTEQEYLQLIFNTLYASPEDFFNPMISNLEKKKEELNILSQQRAELLKNGRAVVVKPSPEGMFGSPIEKGKKIFGSIIGKIKTFGRTQTQTIPAEQMNSQIQEEIQKIELLTQQKKEEFEQYSTYIKQQQELWRNIGKVPSHPYYFYHQVIKPMFGRRLSNMYRKFDLRFIGTPRVVRLPR